MPEKKEKELGKVKHYFSKIGVAVIEMSKGSISVGDKVHIKGATTDFNQDIKSMQIEHERVEKAKKGQSIGLKVDEPVREHDTVFKA